MTPIWLAVMFAGALALALAYIAWDHIRDRRAWEEPDDPDTYVEEFWDEHTPVPYSKEEADTIRWRGE